MPKNVRFGEWDPVKDSSLPDPTITIFSTILEEIMPNAPSTIAKKTIKRKRYPQFVNILKEFIGATIITKRILDLGINLTISKLLTLTPVIKKQLIKAISKDEIVQFYINTLESSER